MWNATLAKREQLIHNLNHAPDQDPQLDVRLAAVEDQLLGLPAPDIEGAITKLTLLWSADLHGEDPVTQHKLLVLGDLRRIAGA